MKFKDIKVGEIFYHSGNKWVRTSDKGVQYYRDGDLEATYNCIRLETLDYPFGFFLQKDTVEREDRKCVVVEPKEYYVVKVWPKWSDELTYPRTYLGTSKITGNLIAVDSLPDAYRFPTIEAANVAFERDFWDEDNCYFRALLKTEAQEEFEGSLQEDKPKYVVLLEDDPLVWLGRHNTGSYSVYDAQGYDSYKEADLAGLDYCEFFGS